MKKENIKSSNNLRLQLFEDVKFMELNKPEKTSTNLMS